MYLFDVFQSVAIILLDMQIVQILGTSLGWLLGPLDMTLVVFDNCLAFSYDKPFQSHFAHFLPQT